MAKIHTMTFSSFMNREYMTPKKRMNKVSLPALSLIPLNPFSVLDPTIISLSLGVLIFVGIERVLIKQGNFDLAQKFDLILKIAFPVAGIGMLIYALQNFPFIGGL